MHSEESLTSGKDFLDNLKDVDELLNKVENKGIFKISSKNKELSPDVCTIVYLKKKDNIIEDFNLAFSINNNAFRVYEVEIISKGKDCQYLYKDSIINIIKNKIKESNKYEELTKECVTNILKSYKGAIEEACRCNS